MVKTIAEAYNFGVNKIEPVTKLVAVVIGITLIQMVFAGLMSGMRAGLYYPTWPDMNGEFIPEVLLNGSHWNWGNMINYDSYLFAPAFIQFTHRIVAYILLGVTIYMYIKLKNILPSFSKKWLNFVLFTILLQVFLGILTVLNVEGKIPLFLGVSHQLVGLLYFISLLFLNYSVKKQHQ
jgi:cytochrome c oxidase assembly protein subunit 15